ncbi:DUF4178 domain-containing protein [Metallumcola ferriviriculae]|uniref:DUF4178 domain-containing protein n=1 Tax=Metallumcola ferriviriculae TaxID=3039180 RepID=A0AAU0UIZ0_9FIRM|nr:DUF4178 domain-containing protein [Desulfitibacteraceae bacterium MK1]
MGFFKKVFGGGDKGKPVVQRNALNLKVGDIVSYDLEDYVVIGVLEYNDEGWVWRDYHLESEGKHIWLSAEQDDELYLGIFEKIKMPLEKPEKRITYDGVHFELDEASTARITVVEGQVGARVGNEVRYWDYCDDEEEKFISIENWDGDFECSYGFEIDPHEVSFMAGS